MDATAGRRWFGAVVLAGALAMLVLGQTVLRDRLKDLEYLFYWIGCFGLTGLAVLVALWDVRALRRRSRQAERALLQSTLQQIEAQALDRQRKQNSGNRDKTGDSRA